jgi:hypothetical protein
LSLDTIVGLDVVLANGTYIHASPTQWQSVFHAMRGAGDSFGIVTFFYLQTESAPTSIINFSASIPAVLDSVTTVTNAFLSLQSIVADPTHINGSISFGFYTDSSGAFSLVGWCIDCDLDSFNAVVFPELLGVFPTPSSQSAVSMGWIDSLRNLAFPTGEPLNEPLYGYDLHDTFYAKSIVTRNAEPPTAAEWANFWSFAINEGRNSPTPWYVDINLYGGAGSRINAPASNGSAYGDRDELWVFQVRLYHLPPCPEIVKESVLLAPEFGSHAYLGRFMDIMQNHFLKTRSRSLTVSRALWLTSNLTTSEYISTTPIHTSQLPR